MPLKTSEIFLAMDRDRSLGYVSTPDDLVRFIVSLASPQVAGCSYCKVLEPGCGSAPFLLHYASLFGTDHDFFGVDIDYNRLSLAQSLLPFGASLFHEDFILWEPGQKFDVILGNPPYGIVGDASHYPIHSLLDRKSEYKRRISTWKGKYNLYAAFIEKSVSMLRPGGVLVFVVPASWLVLEDFSLLRSYLSTTGSIDVFYLGKVFPKVNVSVTVLRFVYGGKGLRLYDLSGGAWKGSSVPEPFLSKPVYSGEVIRFESQGWLDFESSGIPLGEVFEVKFAARSTEFVKSGLVRSSPLPGDVPVLTGRNLKPGFIDYGTPYSGWWMKREDAARIREFYSVPHLVVAHTKGTKLVSAVDWLAYPWREEFHLLPRDGFSPDLSLVEQHLNSERVQKYLFQLYRDFVPHLTKAMLLRVPLPPDILKK